MTSTRSRRPTCGLMAEAGTTTSSVELPYATRSPSRSPVARETTRSKLSKTNSQHPSSAEAEMTTSTVAFQLVLLTPGRELTLVITLNRTCQTSTYFTPARELRT